jgi:hypothetical protein
VDADRHPYIEVVTTFTDPKYYTRPWTIVRTWSWSPDQVYQREYNCEEQSGDPYGSALDGFISEPNN